MRSVLLTRDSVHPGDDFGAPHARSLKLVGETPLALVLEVLKQNYLPSISGGKATWVVSSHKPFAVCAQGWSKPKLVGLPPDITELATKDRVTRLHFSYIGQIEPEIVFDVLWHCKFDLPNVS
jgi:hypothetical protein